jgi:ABC-type Mn2+/Zn2+ transport system permease subunit
MAISAALIAVLTVLGLGLSYNADLPAGATIIVLTGALYLIVIGAASLRSKLRRSHRADITPASGSSR